ELVLLPGGIGEAAVFGFGLDHRLAAIAREALGRGLPELHVVVPEIDLSLDQLGRIGHHPGGHLEGGPADIEGTGMPGETGSFASPAAWRCRKSATRRWDCSAIRAMARDSSTGSGNFMSGGC